MRIAHSLAITVVAAGSRHPGTGDTRMHIIINIKIMGNMVINGYSHYKGEVPILLSPHQAPIPSGLEELALKHARLRENGLTINT